MLLYFEDSLCMMLVFSVPFLPFLSANAAVGKSLIFTMWLFLIH